MVPIIMPQIGQDVETGIITLWHKKVGDRVQKGEVVATVEGDKATFDIEADSGGVLLQIVVPQGQEGRVLEPVGFIGETAERPAAGPAEAPTAETRRFSSPSARRVAQQLNVDLGMLRGSGPGGRIVKKDVLEAAQAGRPAKTRAADAIAAGTTAGAEELASAGSTPGVRADTVIPHTRMRRLIAERLSSSKSTIPHFYLFQDVNMEDALQWREIYNRLNGSKVTVTDMVVHAVASILADFPRLNAHVSPEGITAKGAINIGVATATEDGLLVPVIPQADTKDIMALSAEIKVRTEAARRGRLDLGTQGSFTVSSLGMYGTQAILPIINPPESAILGVGAAEPRPAAIGGLLGIRRMLTLSLACDHRAVNGQEAALFLRRLREVLESRFRPAP